MRLYGFRDVWIKSTKAFDLKPREGLWFRGELAKKTRKKQKRVAETSSYVYGGSLEPRDF